MHAQQVHNSYHSLKNIVWHISGVIAECIGRGVTEYDCEWTQGVTESML